MHRLIWVIYSGVGLHCSRRVCVWFTKKNHIVKVVNFVLDYSDLHCRYSGGVMHLKKVGNAFLLMRSQWWQNLLHKVTFLWQAQWLVTEINPQNETYNYSIVIEHKWFKIQFHSRQEICRNINLLLIRCGKKVHFAACMGTITCVCDVSLGHRDPVSTLYNDSGSINPLQELQIIEEMK